MTQQSFTVDYGLVVETNAAEVIIGEVTPSASPGLSSTSSLALVANGLGTSQTVMFGTDGNLTIPGKIQGAESYDQPNFIQINEADSEWAYGLYASGSDFWMQTKFYGQNQTTRGVRFLEAEGNTVVFSVNGVGNVVASGNVNAAGASITGNITSGNVSTSGLSVTSWTSVPQWWFQGELTTDFTPTTSVDNTIIWNSNSDPGSWGNVSTGHIVPGRPGWYSVTSKINVLTGNTSTAQMNTQIRVNNTNQSISVATDDQAQYNPFTMYNHKMVYLTNITDYITATFYTTTANTSIIGNTVGSLITVQWVSD